MSLTCFEVKFEVRGRRRRMVRAQATISDVAVFKKLQKMFAFKHNFAEYNNFKVY